MWLELPEQNVGRNLAKNIRDEENRQCGVVIRPLRKVQVCFQSQDGCVTDIDSARQTNCQRLSQEKEEP